MLDVDGFFQIIADYLKLGGFVYHAELHPVGLTIDPGHSEVFRPIEGYFLEKKAQLWDEEGTYTDTDWEIQNKKRYEWPYTIAEVISAICKAGLRLEYFHEFPFSVFQIHPDMIQKSDKHWYFKNTSKFNMPILYSLKAYR